jgi:E3 ubiquitin-protein ligase MARCH6
MSSVFSSIWQGSWWDPRLPLGSTIYLLGWCVMSIFIFGCRGPNDCIQASKWSYLSGVVSRLLQTTSPESSPSLPDQINGFFERDSTILRFLEPYFAYLGREVRLVTDHVQKSWIGLTLGNATSERVFAICLGYIIVGMILAIYLNVFTVGSARTAGRAIRNAVRQQMLVVKVRTV